MNSKEKIEKLLQIVATQQKIIEKLAQAKLPEPFTAGGRPGDPLAYDPQMLEMISPTPKEKRPIDRTLTMTPAAKPEPVVGALPASVKAALDRVVPQMKGSLRIEIDANKNVNVSYNADRIRGKASDVESALKRALSPLGYKVLQTMGFSKPLWHPNYL